MRKIMYAFVFVLTVLLIFFEGAYILNGSHGPSHDITEKLPTEKLGVYVINLDRAPDRLAYVMPSVHHLSFPVTRISGIDGKALTPAKIMPHLDVGRHLKYVGKEINAGTAGCSLSHIKAWKTFLASPYEYALIFEDDVSFDPALLQTAVLDALKMPSMWDIVNLENHHRSLNLEIAPLQNNFELVLFLTPVTHTGSYLLNRHAARQLLSKAFPILLPVDYYFSRAWELNLKFTGILPNLVTQSMGTSNISETKSIVENKKSWHERGYAQLTRAIYRVKSDVVRFFYTMYQYIKRDR